LLSEWVERTRDNRWAGLRDAVERTVGIGLAQGQTTQELARRLQDSFELGKREATALVRTAVAHVAEGAREAMYLANDDIVKAVMWVSTLDSRTTGACKLRDGKVYDLKTKKPIGHDLPWNGGPGRLHWQCRSVSVPVLGSWEDLGLDGSSIGPGVRAAMDGEAPGSETYGPWLKRQPLPIKEAALGVSRGRAFHNDPNLTLEEVLRLGGATLSKAARPVALTLVVPDARRVVDEVEAEIAKASAAYEERRTVLEREVDEIRLRLEELKNDYSDEARDESKKLLTAAYRASKALGAMAETARTDFAGIMLRGGTPTKLEVTYATKSARNRSTAVERAQDWLSKVWRRSTPPEAVQVHALRSRRAYYMPKAATSQPNGVHLPADVLTKTVVHEIGHWFEDLDPDLHKALVDWLDSRTKGEALVWLGYGREYARPDKFINAYVGKDYSRNGVRTATEVLSMGLQYLYEDPWKFRRLDPEMFDFMIRIVLGVK
jgi:SPP1 gp7 family putative phage head morphogenesis protein